jgi:hypothetical protein
MKQKPINFEEVKYARNRLEEDIEDIRQLYEKETDRVEKEFLKTKLTTYKMFLRDIKKLYRKL